MRKKLYVIIMVIGCVLFSQGSSIYATTNSSISDLPNDTTNIIENTNTDTQNTANLEHANSDFVLDDNIIVNEEDSIIPSAYTLQSNEMIVNTYTELVNAIENSSNGITTYYLGADLIQTSRGITINPNKASITISGKNPFNSNLYKITENKSTNIDNTIRLKAKPANKAMITFKDLYIAGENNSGFLNIDSSINNVDIVFDKFVYNGPKMFVNKSGYSLIKNSVIDIDDNQYYSENKMLGEVYKLDLVGENYITHVPKSNVDHPMFVVGNNGVINFNEGSKSNIFSSSSLNNKNSTVEINVKSNAQINYTQKKPDTSIIYGGTSSNFNIAPDAVVSLIQDYSIITSSAIDFNTLNASINIDGLLKVTSRGLVKADIINAYDLKATGGEINIDATTDVDSYVINANNSIDLRNNALLKVSIKGNAISLRNGIRYTNNLDMNDSLIDIEIIGSSSNVLFHGLIINIITSDININVLGNTVVKDTNAMFMVDTIKLDGSQINAVFNNNSSIFINSVNTIELINNSAINYNSKLVESDSVIESKRSLSIGIDSVLSIDIDRFVPNTGSNKSVVVIYSDFILNKGKLKLIIRDGSFNSLIKASNRTSVVAIIEPQFVNLYAGGNSNSILNSAFTLRVQIITQQINQWDNIMDYNNFNIVHTAPNYEFYRKDYINTYNLVARVDLANNTTITTNNHTGDDHLNPDGKLSFKTGGNKKLITMGSMELSNDVTPSGSTNLTGMTNSNATVEVNYKSYGNDVSSLGTSNESGHYSVVTQPMDLDEYKVSSYYNNLIIRKYYNSIELGKLGFKNSPSPLVFKKSGIPAKSELIERQDVDWSIEIEDTRFNTSWELLLGVSSFKDELGNELDAELKYIDDNSSITIDNNPTLIASGDSTNRITNIMWNNSNGLLLEVNPGNVYINRNYNAALTFYLVDTP